MKGTALHKSKHFDNLKNLSKSVPAECEYIQVKDFKVEHGYIYHEKYYGHGEGMDEKYRGEIEKGERIQDKITSKSR